MHRSALIKPKRGSSLLVMAIIVGAVCRGMIGRISDAWNSHWPFPVSLVCGGDFFYSEVLRYKPKPARFFSVGSWRNLMIRRFCLTLELKDDPNLIEEYKRYHQQVWPEIIASIKASGIQDMEIYLLGTRMFMIIEADERFSFDAKNEADRSNPKVQEWETLMWKFQQPLPQANPGEKWLLMERVFKLHP